MQLIQQQNPNVFTGIKPKYLGFLFLLLTLFFLPLQALAVDWNSLKVESSIKPKTIHLGDPIRLDITIDADKDISLYYPDAVYNIAPFEITKMEVAEGPLSETLARTKLSYIVTTYNVLGKGVLPTLKIFAKDSMGKGKTITVKGHKLVVKKIIKEENAQLVDIYAPLEPEKKLPILFLTYAFLGVLLGGALLFFLVKKLRKLSGRTAVPSLSPRQKALETLDGLPIEEMEKRLLYFRLSEIIRIFVEHHFRVSAVTKTSSEILADFQKLNCWNGNHAKMKELFFDLDLVKFSPFVPSQDQAKTAMERTGNLIRNAP